MPDNACIGTVAAAYTLAISMGLFRLIHRYRTKQYYWDDVGAAGCVICNLIIFAVIILRESSIEDIKGRRQAQFWLVWFCLPSSLWTSRLSIAFSVLRLIKFGIWRKRLTVTVIAAFTLAWVLTLVDYLIECNVKIPHQPDCSIGVADIVFFVVYIIGDTCLVYIPLHLLRNLRQPRGVRLMVLVTFTVSGVLTLAAIVNTFAERYAGPGNKILSHFISILKAPIALIACSLIVVIPCVYRLFKKEDNWMMSITINVDTSDAGPAITPSVVSLPERVIVRNTSTRSFPEYLSDFHVEASQNEDSCIHSRSATV